MLPRGCGRNRIQEIWVIEIRQDILSDVIYVLNNADNMGKPSCTTPASKMIKNMLEALQKNGYIGKIEFIDNGRSGHFNVEMIGKINKSRIIKPRFTVKKNEFEKWEKRYLPSRDIGILIISTPVGMMTHREAKEKAIGGRLIAYIY